MTKKCCFLILLLCATLLSLKAQYFPAFQGSNDAGSIASKQNPASIVNNPKKWDLTILGIQAEAQSNAIEVKNYSLLSNPKNSVWRFNEGEFKRQLNFNSSINLFNARIAIDRKKSVTLGANIRSITDMSLTRFNYLKTFKDFDELVLNNLYNQNLRLDFTSSSWMEIYGGYAQTVLDNERMRLNIGGALKINNGLFAAEGQMSNLQFQPFPPIMVTGAPIYLLQNGNLNYNYSQNPLQYPASSNPLKSFFTKTSRTLNLDAGMELLIKTQAVTDYFDEDDYYDYRWKIGLSIMDMGYTRFQYNNKSSAFTLTDPQTNIDLKNAFKGGVTGPESFNKSLENMGGTLTHPNGKFNILSPVRMNVNVDYFIKYEYYLNASLTYSLSHLLGPQSAQVAYNNFLTITPRWENARYGWYMPWSMNRLGKFWVGGAVKAGPLVFGINNLKYIFTKNSLFDGGFYLGFIYKSPHLTKAKRDPRLESPHW